MKVYKPQQILTRHLGWTVGKTACIAWLIVSFLFGLYGFAQLSPWIGAATYPEILWVVALSSLSFSSILLPASFGGAWVAVVGRWAQEGVWVGVGSCGVSGRIWARTCCVWGGCLMLLTGSATLIWEPPVRRMLASQVDAVVQTNALAQRWTPVEGGWLWLEDWEGERARDVWWVSAQGVWTATSAYAQGEVWVLEQVTSLGFPKGTYMTASSATLQVGVRDRRIGLTERTLGELREVARRTEASGGDGTYERAVAWKRFVHPLACGLFPMALLPLAVSRRRWWGLGGMGLGYLMVVRLADHEAPWLGAGLSASAGFVWMLVCVCASWMLWRDR